MAAPHRNATKKSDPICHAAFPMVSTNSFLFLGDINDDDWLVLVEASAVVVVVLSLESVTGARFSFTMVLIKNKDGSDWSDVSVAMLVRFKASSSSSVVVEGGAIGKRW